MVDSQEKASMGGSLCEKGRRGSHVEGVEDGKSKWGTRLKEDWKELGVKSNWMELGDGATRSRIEDGWHPSWE